MSPLLFAFRPLGLLHLPARYLLDHDVIKIIEKVNPSMSLTELAQDDDIVASFFGNDRIAKGRALMVSLDNESDASAMEEESNDES